MSNFGGSLEFGLQEAPSAAKSSTRGLQESVQGFSKGSFALPHSLSSLRELSKPEEHGVTILVAHLHSGSGHYVTPSPWSDAIRAASSFAPQRPPEPVAESIDEIEAHYIITDGREQVVVLVNKGGQLRKLLLEALPALRECFGDRLLQLQANSDGDDISLKATILWPDDVLSARAALDNFDRSWWLDNCARAHGYLVFDYELADGI